MKYAYYILFALFLSCNSNSENQIFPPPTEIVIDAENKEKHHQRLAWLEAMHPISPGRDWRSMEYATQIKRQNARKNELENRGDEEILADGQLIGTWKERGSNNQAGNVVATAYDAMQDEIYLISAGGTLWKGKRDGSQWQVVNQDFRFQDRSLELIMKNGQMRFITVINKIVHYSDDSGITWAAAEGLETSYDNWGWRDKLERTEQGMYLPVQEWDVDAWESTASIYYTANNGESFSKIRNFGSSNLDNIVLARIEQNDQLFCLEKTGTTLTTYHVQNDRLDLLHTVNMDLGDKAANLTATLRDGVVWLYIYNGDNELFLSKDEGATWELIGNLPASPWSVGIYISPSNPDMMYMGEVECFRSNNAGISWERVNGWGEYYSDVEFKLHADIMEFNEFETQDGSPFLLISNHGGLSISYDYSQTNQNIGLAGLNVSQYYSSKTLPSNTDFVYAGTQDQGFQRAFEQDADIPLDFEQVISGDYGHIIFSDNGSKLWTVYPGGWVTYYADPKQGYLTASFDLESENETVWIPPLTASPNPQDQQIYLAGGNINGGPGSHIIELTPQGETIETYQYPFDFKDNSDGEVSAMEISPLNNRLWYVGTTNGRFFYSENGGATWEQSFVLVPEPHYLYGATILASKIDENIVYMGGSGYEDAPVYISYDQGRSFAPMREGMPPTLVFEIVANADESMLFAATEAGPYVYSMETERWYEMHASAAPTQTYWSVEFLEDKNLVRFGTYGRGIWDFQISDEMVTVTSPSEELHFEVFPNPARTQFSVKLPTATQAQLTVYNTLGEAVHKTEINGTNVSLNVSDMPAGVYFVEVISGEKRWVEQLILQ